MSEQSDVGLSVDDLMNALRVINTATERGAFKANELSFVGQVYDKFSTFVRAAQEEAKSQQPQDGESSEDGSE
jgi:hypothetical protein